MRLMTAQVKSSMIFVEKYVIRFRDLVRVQIIGSDQVSRAINGRIVQDS